MRYWNTGDDATDANLRFLESLGSSWDGMSVEHFTDKVRGAIAVRQMLPAAVSCRFSFPFLVIGEAAYDWKPERLAEEASRLCQAINDGLDHAAEDPSLKRGGGADLSDRPRFQGERELDALEAYRKNRGEAELNQLRVAASSTRLHRDVAKLERALQRKRPTGGISLEQEILRAIKEVEGNASRYHHERAPH